MADQLTNTVYFDPASTNASINSATLLSGISAAFNNGPGSYYGVVMEIKTTSGAQDGLDYTPLLASDLAATKLAARGVVAAITRYTQGYVRGLEFDQIFLVKSVSSAGNPIVAAGFATASGDDVWLDADLYTLENDVTTRMAITTHHEMFHIAHFTYVQELGYQDGPTYGWPNPRADWLALNPSGFTYLGGNYNQDGVLYPTGFARDYARATYSEDLAETLSFRITPGYTAQFVARFPSDTILAAKSAYMADFQTSKNSGLFVADPPGVPMAQLGTLVDSFAGPAFNGAIWAYTGTEAVIEAGRAKIPVVAGSFRTIDTASTHTLKDSHVLAEMVPPATGGAGSQASVTMGVWVNSNIDGRNVEIKINRETNKVTFATLAADYSTDIGGKPTATIDYDAAIHKWFAIVDSTSPIITSTFGVSFPDTTKIYFFTSATGQPGSWTEQRTGADRLTRPAWLVATQSTNLSFTGYRASGVSEFAYVDNLNNPQAAPSTALVTSTFQDNFTAGNLDKWAAGFGNKAAVNGKGQVTVSGVDQYGAIATDVAAKRTLDYLEAEVWVEGVAGADHGAFFGLFAGNGGESLLWTWGNGVWTPRNWTSGYTAFTPDGTAVPTAAGTAVRLAICKGSSATRYGAGPYNANDFYMFSAPAGTTTWTQRMTAVMPAWTSVGGFINFEASAGVGAAASRQTIDDVNLLTATIAPTVPSAPTNFVAQRVAGSSTLVSLSFGAPTNNGNSTILDYALRQDGVLISSVTPTVAGSYTVTSDANAHSFTVIARNGVGTSLPATASVAAFTAVAGLQLLGSARDDFNDSALDAEWVTSGGVVQAAGAVAFPTPTPTPARIYRRGDFRAQSCFFKVTPIPTSGATSGMFVRSTALRSNRLRIFVRDGVIYSANEVNGLADASQAARPYSATNDRYFRIRHDGTVIRLETSATGATWTALGRSGFAAPTWLSDAEVGLEVFSSTATPNQTNLPTVPTAVTRTTSSVQADGSYSVDMTWSPPTSDGGSPITGYVVGRDGSDIGGFGEWSTMLPATARNQPFSRLAPGVKYNIYVRAVNANSTTGGETQTAEVTIPGGSVPTPAAGADFTEDFTVLPDLSTAGTKWTPNLPYWNGGYNGAKDPAGNSWNAVPSQTLSGLQMNPYSIIDDAGATEGKALRVTLRRTTTDEKNAITAAGAGGSSNWVGGALCSKPTFQRGYFEWRMRLPNSGAGMFPAIWTYSGHNVGNDFAHAAAEIDMAEVFGSAAGVPWASAVHVRDGSQTGTAYGIQTSNLETKGWHTYGLEVTATTIRFYRDNVQIGQADTHAGYFANGANDGGPVRMDVRINYTCSDNGNPGWMPSTDSSTPSALYMDVDYFRHYPTKPA